MGITNPTDWQYLFPLDAYEACTVELVLWIMITAMPCRHVSFVWLERCEPAGTICWDWLIQDFTPSRLSNGPYSELSRVQIGCSREHSAQHSR